eukprot:scaffold11763_cov71-Phaeocystis_antarctica.AAC.5
MRLELRAVACEMRVLLVNDRDEPKGPGLGSVALDRGAQAARSLAPAGDPATHRSATGKRHHRDTHDPCTAMTGPDPGGSHRCAAHGRNGQRRHARRVVIEPAGWRASQVPQVARAVPGAIAVLQRERHVVAAAAPPAHGLTRGLVLAGTAVPRASLASLAIAPTEGWAAVSRCPEGTVGLRPPKARRGDALRSHRRLLPTVSVDLVHLRRHKVPARPFDLERAQ